VFRPRGAERSHKAEVPAGPALIQQEAKENPSQGVVHPDKPIVGVQFGAEKAGLEPNSGNAPVVETNEEEGQGRGQEARQHDQTRPSQGLSRLHFDNGFSEKAVLKRPHEAKPAASDAPEEGGRDDEEGPYQDDDGDDAPIDGMPDKGEVEEAEEDGREDEEDHFRKSVEKGDFTFH